MGRSQRKIKEREAMLLEEMSERVDIERHTEKGREEGRHLEGSGHTCHIPFI